MISSSLFKGMNSMEISRTPGIPGIVSLSELYHHLDDNHVKIKNSLDTTVDLDAALYATLETLKVVYESDTKNDRGNIIVSFIKTTKNTNTSVISGIASKFNEKVLILNCGTGSIKYQYYKKGSDGIVTVLGEHKPKTVSFSNFPINGYYDVKENATSLNSMIMAIKRDLKELPWNLDKNVKVVAMITSNIRKAWQKSNAKEQFEGRVHEVFDKLNILPWDGKSFFITQEDEGAYESIATSNLIRDVNPDYDCVINLGIGRGSSQWTTIRNGVPVTTKHEFGMSIPEKLVGDVSLKKTVQDQFKDPKYVEDLNNTCKNTKYPVIALKSGCLIKLNKDPGLKRLVVPFIGPVEPTDHKGS